jgi:hypothetical protein
MNNPNPTENEFGFLSCDVRKLLGPGNNWEYTVTFISDNPNLMVSSLMTCNKQKLQDLKDENDQCLLEIDRLEKKVAELELQVEVLQSHKNNQAKMLLDSEIPLNSLKKYFPIMPKKQHTYY